MQLSWLVLVPRKADKSFRRPLSPERTSVVANQRLSRPRGRAYSGSVPTAYFVESQVDRGMLLLLKTFLLTKNSARLSEPYRGRNVYRTSEEIAQPGLEVLPPRVAEGYYSVSIPLDKLPVPPPAASALARPA